MDKHTVNADFMLQTDFELNPSHLSNYTNCKAKIKSIETSPKYLDLKLNFSATDSHNNFRTPKVISKKSLLEHRKLTGAKRKPLETIYHNPILRTSHQETNLLKLPHIKIKMQAAQKFSKFQIPLVHKLKYCNVLDSFRLSINK